MTTPNKALLTIRDASLNAEVLWDAGVALNPQRTEFMDANGDWWPMVWDEHEQRYLSPIAHVDAILRKATICMESD